MNRALVLAVAAAFGLSLLAPAPASAQTSAPAHAVAVATPTAAAATPQDTGGPDTDATPPALPRLHTRSAEAFRSAADKLQPGVAQAVRRDLHIDPAQYLAQAAAAQDAGALVGALRDRTGATVSARLDGTAVTVYASDAQAASLAREAGATAVVGAAPHQPVPQVALRPLSGEVYGGQPYLIKNPSGAWRCSAGFPGYSVASGAPQLLSAGHCVEPGSTTSELTMTEPQKYTGSDGSVGAPLGSWVSGANQFGGDADSSLIALTAGHTPQSSALSWGANGTGAPLGSAPMTVTSVGAAVAGAPLCKSGSTTGWTCGTIEQTDVSVSVEDEYGTHVVNSIIATTCADHGDSGGAAMTGGMAVGIVSAGPDLSCSDPNYFTAFYPLVSSTGGSSVMSRYAGSWEPAVSVTATVAVTSLPAGNHVTQGGTISGTASGPLPSGTTVRLQLASESKARVATVVNGAWSVSLVGAPSGATSFTVRAAYGTRSVGPAVGGPLTIDAIQTQRIAGADRFDTSVKIAQQAYPTTAKTVYVATGLNYPDALSAGPAAAKEGGPLLLVAYTLSDAVRNEILSLHPEKIRIVGGVNAVPPAIESALDDVAKQVGATVTRIAGSDRFETSRRLATTAFGASIPTAFVATAMNFPDALAAGAAAGASGAPVLLVNGGAPSIDPFTTAYLLLKGTTTVKVVGGDNVVSPGVLSGLGLNGVTVTRLSGSDRFETAEQVGRASFPTFTTAYLASGLGFPDALAGSALAAVKGAPLFTTNGGCVPRSVLSDLAAQKAQRVFLLGGTAVLGSSLNTLTSC
ncbi:cell wall-binding repeat-containing protein [Leifsonia sp. NPDC077715]|uniref:cell wall-binding repeat-containing protein n=1 Tax=Leifsonia sp. NPDC077715 TaxID=3155539 RepID=UPI00342D931A